MNAQCRITAAVMAVVATIAATTVQAALRPEEIAIVAVRGNRESEALAEYYAQQRQIPEDNICLVVMPRGETITREKWRWAVRPEIGKWLADNDSTGRIRCLATVWGVPLKIGPAAADSPQGSRYREYLEGERTHRVELLKDIIASFELLAPGVADVSGADAGERSDPASQDSEFAKLQQQLETELQAAQRRIGGLTDNQQRGQATARLQQLATAAGGAQVLLQSLDRRLAEAGEQGEDPQTRAGFERLRGSAAAYAQFDQLLERRAPSIERDSLLLDILSRGRGLIKSIEWLDEQLKVIDKNQTGASFDSELSLVLWPDDYQLLRWQPNYLRAEFDHSQLRDTYRTLMVSRIDAPTYERAKDLIDSAIEVEEQGLQGKVYLDARGIGKLDQPQVAPGSYADYDRALLLTAEGFRQQTTMEVVLNESPELFQAEECPDAALYCGWYSLAKYVDAFQWNRGAVAYHLASAEARTLHDPESEVWCKRLLEEGVCATMGPVQEPYLMAFPRPNEFFSLLIQGELTLVECYYRTKLYNSWAMTLIGDPLYRPFAKHGVTK